MDLTQKTVLVTGASGFVGGHLAIRLATERAAHVRALVRQTSRTDHLQGFDIELCQGDITELDSLRSASDGVDVVFHTAAIAREWGKAEEMHRVNTLGTDNVLRAAVDAGVARVVHTSSIAVYGLEPADDTDESFPFNPASGNPYADSKIAAEELAQTYYRDKGLHVTILRPAEIYGPRSSTATVGPVLAIRMGWMELIDGGEGLCNHVYVDNLVDAYILAAENEDAAGEAYIISDGLGTPWRDFFGRYAQMAGKGPLPSITKEQAMQKAAEEEAKAEKRVRAPALTRAAVTLMTQKAVFSIDKARRELGYVPRISLDEGTSLTEAWLREKGYV